VAADRRQRDRRPKPIAPLPSATPATARLMPTTVSAVGISPSHGTAINAASAGASAVADERDDARQHELRQELPRQYRRPGAQEFDRAFRNRQRQQQDRRPRSNHAGRCRRIEVGAPERQRVDRPQECAGGDQQESDPLPGQERRPADRRHRGDRQREADKTAWREALAVDDRREQRDEQRHRSG
jgi:hypothetical protein